MAAHYREDVVLARTSPMDRTDEIERLNAALDREGLGRPFGAPRNSATTLTVLPTTVEPAVVREAVRRLRHRGADVLAVDLDYRYTAGTAAVSARQGSLPYYVAAGCQTGHGTAAWLPAPEDEMPAAPAWRSDGGRSHRPVVALLDTGVAEHSWLPPVDPDDPFVTSPWTPSEPIPAAPAGTPGRYHGHGTFNAGLIRFTAPTARVLSIPVMSDDGLVDESRLVEALDWLADRRADGEPLDAVCLPFGRSADDPDDSLDALRRPLARLAGVTVVASAGNDGVDCPTYPAAFAVDPHLSVVSVGSCDSATERASYSNHGVWVRQWRGGTNLVSVLPMRSPQGVPRDGYAWWSGTSFAAVRYAAEAVNRPAGADSP